MKFSKETLALLSNFASINQNLAMLTGNQLDSVSTERNIRVSAKIAENIPSDFYIYDLSTFLNILSLVPDAECEFSEEGATIVDGKRKIKYMSADKSILALPASPQLPKTTTYEEFDISEGTLASLRKAATVLSAPNIQITGDGEVITASVIDLKNPLPNTFQVEIGTTTKTFNADFQVSTFKMLTGDYNVVLDSNYVSKWSLQGKDYIMFIAMVQSSKFD